MMWRKFASRAAAAMLVACTSAVLVGEPSRAQTPSATQALPATQADLRAAGDALFKRMLVKPDDLDAAFRFSEIQSQLGDYEAAIGALERMLFYNRDLPRVKLELGLLYFRLGSYEQARSYFNAAIAAGDTPQDVRQRVTSFLAQIDRRLSVNQFAFFAQAGIRSQSNANAGPDSATVRALGFNAVLAPQFTRKRDANAFGIIKFTHVYDFENQRGDVWESNVTAYYARQFKISALNLGLIEVDTGPRLALGEANIASIRPYAVGNIVTLADRQYLAAGGAGLSLRYSTDIGLTLEPGVEIRGRNFSNSPAYPTATDQQGRQVTAALAVNAPLNFIDGLKWQSRFSYARVDASNRAYSSNQFALEVALPYEFDGPLGQAGHKWTFAPFASYSDTSYVRVNPLVDPNIKRHDREFHVGANLDMVLFDNFGFGLQAQYVKTLSSLPNYRTNSFIVSGGPTLRF